MLDKESFRKRIIQIGSKILGAYIQDKKSSYGRLVYEIIDDEDFLNASGSSKSSHAHHYGEGGLMEHTYEVVDSCIKIACAYNLSLETKQILFLAALYHDYGKIFDYTKNSDGDFIKTSHANKIHHISSSNIKWNQTAKESKIDQHIIEEVTHAILAHHQLKEWGSPVQPQTEAAWILHNCDSISARINQIKSNKTITN